MCADAKHCLAASQFRFNFVDLFHLLLILFLSDFSPQFHGRGQLAAALAEVTRKKHKLLNMSCARNRLRIGLIHTLLNVLVHFFVLYELGGGLEFEAKFFLEVLLRLFFEIVGGCTPVGHVKHDFESDEGAHEATALANEHDIAAAGAEAFEGVLNGYRSNILATRRNDQLFGTASDLDEPIRINNAAIACVEEAILINAAPGCLFVVLVAHHDMAA